MLGSSVFRSLAVVALLFVGAASAHAQTPKDTLIFASGNDADTLDPHFLLDRPAIRVSTHIHECLIYFDAEGNLKPQLALSWSVSEDRLTWTFNLRKGVVFHDGTPFGAEAVKASFERLLDSATGSPRRSIGSMIEEVKVVDDETVALRTKERFAPFASQVSVFTLAIMSPTAIKKYGKSYGQHPSGTGPFKLESHQPGEKVTLVRNDAYWGEKPTLKRLEFRVVPEDAARILQLLSGEADVVANVPPVLVNKLKASSGVNLLQETSFRTVLLGINFATKPFDDLRVRQALAHAIDTTALVKGVLNNLPKNGGGIEAPEIPGARKDLKPYAFDPALSKKLLAEAGYADGFKTSLLTPTGRLLNDRQLAEAIQAQAKAVGIDIRIDAPDWATYTKMLTTKEAPLTLSSKGNPTGDLDLTMNLVAHSKGGMNYYNWRNDKVDQLIADQRGETDEAKRRDMLSEIQQAIYDDLPLIALFYDAQIYASRANVSRVVIQPNEMLSLADARKN